MMDARRAARLSAGMLAAAVLLLALVWTDPLQPQNLYPIDTWWHDLAVAPTGLAHLLGRAMEELGGDPIALIVRVGVAAWLTVRRRWADLAAWLAAWAITEVLVNTLKGGVGRLRPDGSDTRSFPSGHAAAAGQIATGLALLTERLPHPRIRWGVAVAWIAAMAWSRTALDVHHLSDVLAGTLIGAGVMFGSWSLTRRWEADEAEGVAAPGQPSADSPA